MRKMISFELDKENGSGSEPRNADIRDSIPHGLLHLSLCLTLVTKEKNNFSFMFVAKHIP